MVRWVFFSFHYKEDSWRANVVRQSWVTKPDRRAAGYIDKAGWEKIKKQGDAAVKKWIDDSLLGTSVTTVLIGTKTSTRKWVRYEVKKSYERGNGMFGVYIHNIRNQNGETTEKGDNNFGIIGKDKNGDNVYFNDLYPTYWWGADNGYENFGTWVEDAAKSAGR